MGKDSPLDEEIAKDIYKVDNLIKRLNDASTAANTVSSSIPAG
jgi:hypothetical protein